MASRPPPAQGGLRLWVGPDRVRKLERLQAMAQELSIELLDCHRLDATHLSASTLSLLIREQPAASELRLIVIDQAHRLSEPCAAVLQEQARATFQTACVILLMDGPLRTHDPLNTLEACATVESFERLSDQEASRWVARYLSDHHKHIATAALRDLLQLSGADLAALRVTLNQLISWVGARPQITSADLQVFLQTPVPRHTFALVNAIAQQDAAAALRALGEELSGGKEPLEVVGLVVWQVQRWLTLARLLEARALPEQIEAVTGLSTWQLDRLRAELAGRPLDWLRQILLACWELDVAAKRGRVPILRVALEELVVRLCLPAPAPARVGPWPAPSQTGMAERRRLSPIAASSGM